MAGSEKDVWELDGSGNVLGKYRIKNRSGKGVNVEAWVKSADFDKQWKAKYGESDKKNGARLRIGKGVDISSGKVLSGDEFKLL